LSTSVSIVEHCGSCVTMGHDVSRLDLVSPQTFARSSAGRAAASYIVSHCYYSRYWRDGNDRPLSLRSGSELGHDILASQRMRAARQDADACHFDPIARFFGHGESPQEHLAAVASSLSRQVIDDVAEQLFLNHGVQWPPPGADGDDDWTGALDDAATAIMVEQDTSTAADMLRSSDRAEAIVILGRHDLDAEDSALQSHRPWAAPSEMAIDAALQAALAPLGYSITAFRKLFRNRHAAGTSLLRPRMARSRLVTPEALAEVIENACSSWFVLCLYAIVPVSDFIGLDPSKPIVVKNAHFASYNPLSGTFHSATKLGEVTLRPEQCEVTTAHGWYAPSEICGLVESCYHGRIGNT
jgi:hypothetical protein